MKRLDLLVNERELELLRKRLEQVGVPGYSVNRHVTGRGGSGTVVSEAMEFSGLGANAHVIVFCDSSLLESLAAELKPLLKTYGGVAYVSDAQPL